MIRRAIVRPSAVEDVVDAAARYEAQSPGLGEELIDEVLRAVHRAGAQPELFRVIHRNGAVRRILTRALSISSLFLCR